MSCNLNTWHAVHQINFWVKHAVQIISFTLIADTFKNNYVNYQLTTIFIRLHSTKLALVLVTFTDNEVGLFGGPNPREGRLEVFHKDIRGHKRWGTVCDDGFTDAAARVVCYSLGFGFVSKRSNYNSVCKCVRWVFILYSSLFCRVTAQKIRIIKQETKATQRAWATIT